MATRIRLLNDENAVWNDRDFMAFNKNFITGFGAGFLNVHRSIAHFLNGGFESGSGSISSSGWIGSDAYNAWYGFIAGTATIAFDSGSADEGSQSLKIDQTVNNGSQVSGIRLTENASGFDSQDLRHLIPVKGGKTVELGYSLKTSSVTAGSGKGAQVAIQAYDADGTATGSEQTSTLVTGTQAFTDATLTVELPDDAAYIQIIGRIVNTTGAAWFDSMTLTEVGSDMELTANDPASATLDIATGICFFEVEDAEGNIFVIEFEVEEEESLNVTNNATAFPRIDIIVAKYDDSIDLNVDGSNVGTIEIVQGTPDASPVAASVPANCLKIGEVYVAAGASVFSSAVVTDSRVPVTFRNMQVESATGEGQIPSYDQAKAPATPVQVGTVVLNEEYAADPTRPRVPTMEYPGLFTAEEKTQALVAIPSSDFILGEAFPSDNPIPFAQNLTANSTDDIYDANWVAQTFLVPANMTHIKIVDIDLGKHVSSGSWSTVTGNLNVSIYATDGTQPTGAALGTVQIPVAEIPGNNGTGGYQMLKRCTFSSAVAVTGGQKYAIVVEASGISGDASTRKVRVGYQNSDVYADGQRLNSANSGSTWSTTSNDLKFRVHGLIDDVVYPYYRQKSTYTELCICDEGFNGSLSALAPIYGANNFSVISFRAIGFDYLTRVLIRMDKVGTPAQTINFELYASDAYGAPTGAVLATGSTYASASVSTSETDIPVTFNYQLTEGNRYVIKVSMPGGGDGSNYVTTMYSSNTTLPPIIDLYSTNTTDGGSTYSNQWPALATTQNNPTIGIMGYKKRTTDRVYRADATHPDRQRIIGFPTDVSTAKAAGDSFELKLEGIISGFSGLTIGTDYFLPINGDFITSGADVIPALLNEGASVQSNIPVAFAGNFFKRLFDGAGMVYLGRAISATEMIRPAYGSPEFLGVLDDASQDKSVTSYLDVPKDARGAIVRIQANSTNDTYVEMFVYKHGKRTVYKSDSSGTTKITVNWNVTTGKLEMSDNITGSRGLVTAYFFR